jgi:hypothetical protein
MEEGWTIDIDAVGDVALADDQFEQKLETFRRALDAYSASVEGSREEGHYGARFSLDTVSINPVEVLQDGLFIFHDAAADADLPPWQVVRCEILTYEEDDTMNARESEEPG